MNKKSFSRLILAAALISALSAVAFADETTYSCTAGVTIPKHVITVWGDSFATQEQAMASAMEACRKQASFSDYCRPLACYTDSQSNN